jgi:hypothetical protein
MFLRTLTQTEESDDSPVQVGLTHNVNVYYRAELFRKLNKYT